MNEVLIAGEEDRSRVTGKRPDLAIGSAASSKQADVERVWELWTEGSNQGLGKILVDQKPHLALRRDDQAPPLPLGRVEQAGSHVLVGELRELAEQFLLGHGGKVSEDIANRQAGAANGRFPESDLGICDNALKQVHVMSLRR